MSKGSHLKGRGPWSEAEDKILRDYVNEHGAGSWKSAVENSGLKRDAQSCRLRWGSYLDPNVDRSPFTDAEDRILLQMVSWEGSTNWVGIATSAFPTRTGYQLQGRWHMLMNKMRKTQGSSRSPAWLEPGLGSAEKGGWMLKREWSEDTQCPQSDLDGEVPSGRSREGDHPLFPASTEEERDGRVGAGWEEGRRKRQREGGSVALQSDEKAAKRQVEGGDWVQKQKQMETLWGGSWEEQGRMTGVILDRWCHVATREGWGLPVEAPAMNDDLDLNLSLSQNNGCSPSSGTPWGKGGVWSTGKGRGSFRQGGVEEVGGGGERLGQGGAGEATDLELRLCTESSKPDREKRLDAGMGLDLEGPVGESWGRPTLPSPSDLDLAQKQQKNSLAWLASMRGTGTGRVGGGGGGLGSRDDSTGLPLDFLLSVPPRTSFGPIPRSTGMGWCGYDWGGGHPSDVAAPSGEEVKQSVVLHADTGVPLEDLTPTSGVVPVMDFGKCQVSPSPWATWPGTSLELSRATSAIGLHSARSLSSASPWSASPQSALTSSLSSQVSPAPRTIELLSASSSPIPRRVGGVWSMLGVNAGSMPDLSFGGEATRGGGMSRSSSLTHMPSPLSQQGPWMVGAEAWRQRAIFGGGGSNDKVPLAEES